MAKNTFSAELFWDFPYNCSQRLLLHHMEFSLKLLWLFINKNGSSSHLRGSRKQSYHSWVISRTIYNKYIFCKIQNSISVPFQRRKCSVDEFVCSLEKSSIASLAHQCMLCSEWVPSEWESKPLINTSQLSTPLQSIS